MPISFYLLRTTAGGRESVNSKYELFSNQISKNKLGEDPKNNLGRDREKVKYSQLV